MSNSLFSNWDRYAAASLGAFCIALGDIVRSSDLNAKGSVARLVDAAKYIYPDFLGDPFIIIAILMVLGSAVCWLNGVENIGRVDAFARGLSVFAVLTVAAPPNYGPVADSPIVDSVEASVRDSPDMFSDQVPKESISDKIQAPSSGVGFFFRRAYAEQLYDNRVIVSIRFDFGVNESYGGIISADVRRGESGEVLRRLRVVSNSIFLKEVPGEYIVELESSFGWKAQFRVEVSSSPRAYYVDLSNVAQEHRFGEFFGARRVAAKEIIGSVGYRDIGIAFFKSRMYLTAIEYYDKSLLEDPENAGTLNFKGYSLFRYGNIEEAKKSLELSVKISPSYFWGRLNLAKVLCASKDFDGAVDVLLRGVQLSSTESATALGDYEFVRLCEPIISAVKERAEK